MTNYIATAGAVKVHVGPKDGNTVAVIIREGDIVPEGVDEGMLEGLVERGLIAALEETEPEVADPYKGKSADELKAELATRNEGREEADKIVPAEPGHKPEVLAALKADDAKQAEK